MSEIKAEGLDEARAAADCPDCFMDSDRNVVPYVDPDHLRHALTVADAFAGEVARLTTAEERRRERFYSLSGGTVVEKDAHDAVVAQAVALQARVTELEAEVTRLATLAQAAVSRADTVEAKCDALEERLTTADVPWRVPGCQCPSDSKPADRCDARWSRCNARLNYLRAVKATEKL